MFLQAAEFDIYNTYIYDQVQQEEEETIGTYRRIKEMLDDPANREFFKVNNWNFNLYFVFLFQFEDFSLKIDGTKEFTY